MFGTISGEVEVNAPASVVWEVYSSLQLAAIVEKGLNAFIEKIEVVEGDGSVGTVLKLLFRPGIVKQYSNFTLLFGTEDQITEKIIFADISELDKLECVDNISPNTLEKAPKYSYIFDAGVVAFPYYKEKFIKIDHEKRVKDVTVVEGGYLDMGFDRYLTRLEIIEKDEKSCITKSTIEYDIKEGYAANASLVSIDALMVVMNLAAIQILAKPK